MRLLLVMSESFIGTATLMPPRLPSYRPNSLRLHAPYRSSHRTRFFCVAKIVLRPHVTRASVSRRFVFIEMTSDSTPAAGWKQGCDQGLSDLPSNARAIARPATSAISGRRSSEADGCRADSPWSLQCHWRIRQPSRKARPPPASRRSFVSACPPPRPLSRKRPRCGRRPSRFANVSILQPPARHRTCSRGRAAPSNRCWRRCRPRRRWSELRGYRYRGRSSGIRPCRSGCR